MVKLSSTSSPEYRFENSVAILGPCDFAPGKQEESRSAEVWMSEYSAGYPPGKYG